MGSNCCQATHNVELETIAQDAYLFDYTQSEWPEDNDLHTLLKLSTIYNKSINKFPLKHKVYNRWFWGNWIDGRPTGLAILYNRIGKDSIYYEGQFQGQPCGQGRVIYNGGFWEYSGAIKKGKAHGIGKFINKKQGYQFQGQWKQSKPYIGKLILDSNAQDNFRRKQSKSNEIQGKIQIQLDLSTPLKPTKILYPDGKIYMGEINRQRFIPHGQGVLQFPNKNKYTGEWEDGQMHGEGKFQWSDGSVYEGQYKYGKKCGIGKFLFSSTRHTYEGYWKNGKQSGRGILFDSNKKQIKNGNWNEGKFIQNQLK